METGNFILQGSSWVAGGSKFVVRKRKQPVGNKPEKYLIQFEPNFKYISSLFPKEEEGLYSFDYERKVYLLKEEKDKVIITEAE